MTGSFIAALGGLRAHQDWIDVIGNNLANSNTPGFKQSRALFSDMLAVTLRPGTQPTGAIGGTNPLQKGLGVRLASVDRTFEQGALNTTGRSFDLALLGKGFFAVDNGTETLYTRVGTFGLDANGNMVDVRSGYRVLDANGQAFQIDTSSVAPPTTTSQIGFAGNLPAEVTGPLAEELTTSSPLSEGTSAALTGTIVEPFTVPAGETYTMQLIADGGAPQQVSLAAGTYTAAQIANEINLQTTDVTASDAGGQVVVASDRTGEVSTVRINAGSTGSDLKGLLGLGDFTQGTETTASLTTDLNLLVSNVTDYAPGDVIQLSGTGADGQPVVASFTYGTDGTTVGDLVTFLDAQYTDASVSFDAASGSIQLLADATGEADLTLVLSDGTAQTGGTEWTSHLFSVSTNGAGPDVVTSSIEIFDSLGSPHVLTVDYERQDDGTWTMNASLPDGEGTVIAGTVPGLDFGDDGSLRGPTQASIQVQFEGLPVQELSLNLGTEGNFDGLTQFGTPATAVANFQNGFGPGELVNVQVGIEGQIEGFYSNGQVTTLGNIGIATFTNEAGLEEVGGSYVRASPNSGTRLLGAGLSGGAGEVVGGALENSNVDTASEFVQLIQAQRGFQANARVITVQDELFAEVVNVV